MRGWNGLVHLKMALQLPFDLPYLFFPIRKGRHRPQQLTLLFILLLLDNYLHDHREQLELLTIE